MVIRKYLNSIVEKFDNDLRSLRAAISFLTLEDSSINELQVYLKEHEKEKDSYRRQFEYLSRLDENEKKTLCVLGLYIRTHDLDLTKNDVFDWVSEDIESEIMDTLFNVE